MSSNEQKSNESSNDPNKYIILSKVGPQMAIDKQCPILDWRNYSDLILSKEDLQFASNQTLSVEQLQLIFSTFERVVNFKSYLLSYNDMKTKILFEYPHFERDLSAITSRLSQTNDDRECVLELAFVYW